MKLDLDEKVILVTGGAGFIGSNLVKNLLLNYKNNLIVSLDNLNEYYDVNLKKWRLSKLEKIKDSNNNKYVFKKIDISDKEKLKQVFNEYKFDIVINLAAQAGVRYSINHPDDYIKSNILGFYNILENSRKFKIKHLVFASSSSVYGTNDKIPYNEDDKADSQVSLYAATKKSNESMAHAYSKLYAIPSTGLRFFTVYGPAGRPDMAYFNFTNKLLNNEIIEIFNYGNCKRDFTYIDDIIKGILKVISNPPSLKYGEDKLPIPPYEIYNIGNGKPIDLMEFVNILEEKLKGEKILPEDYNLKNNIKFVPMQPGDVEKTYADTRKLEKNFNYKPSVNLECGLEKFAKWYKEFYK